MKTKNLILALVAIVFAVGSAFTSQNEDVVNNVYVKWKQTSAQQNFTCQLIPRECNLSGLESCQVTITKSDGSNETVFAYDAANCTTILKHNGPVPPIYDAGSGRPFDVE
jgi:hypothetical protein